MHKVGQSSPQNEDEPVVTAKKYIAYKKANGHINKFETPKIILVCYQHSVLHYLKEKYPDITQCDSFSDLYFINNGKIGILAGWGFGAPALVTKLEQLIELGVKKIVAIGLAGSLVKDHKIGDFVISRKALAEDGVSHLYLPENVVFASADEELVRRWNQFSIEQALPNFHDIPTWSFPAIFRETPRAIKRVKALGCGLVEMEAATLYAIGQDKNVQTLSLFVISDTITEEMWSPHLKEPGVKDSLKRLSDFALNFCGWLIN